MKKWKKPELIVIETIESSETVLDYSLNLGGGNNEEDNVIKHKASDG